MARLIPAGTGAAFRGGAPGMAARPGLQSGGRGITPQDALTALKLAEALGESRAVGALATGVEAGVGKLAGLFGGGPPDARAEAARRLGALRLPAPEVAGPAAFQPVSAGSAPFAPEDDAARLERATQQAAAARAAGLRPGDEPPEQGEAFPPMEAGPEVQPRHPPTPEQIAALPEGARRVLAALRLGAQQLEHPTTRRSDEPPPPRQIEFSEAEVEPFYASRGPAEPEEMTFEPNPLGVVQEARNEAARRMLRDPLARARLDALAGEAGRSMVSFGAGQPLATTFTAGQALPPPAAAGLPPIGPFAPPLTFPPEALPSPAEEFTFEPIDVGPDIRPTPPVAAAQALLPPGGGGGVAEAAPGPGSPARQAKIDAVVERVAEALAQGASGAEIIAGLVRRGARPEEAQDVVRAAQTRAGRQAGVAPAAAPSPPPGRVFDVERAQQPGATPETAARPMTVAEALAAARAATTPEQQASVLKAAAEGAEPETLFDRVFGTHRVRAVNAVQREMPKAMSPEEAARKAALAAYWEAKARGLPEDQAIKAMQAEASKLRAETGAATAPSIVAKNEAVTAALNLLTPVRARKLEAEIARLNAEADATARGAGGAGLTANQVEISTRTLYNTKIAPMAALLKSKDAEIRTMSALASGADPRLGRLKTNQREDTMAAAAVRLTALQAERKEIQAAHDALVAAREAQVADLQRQLIGAVGAGVSSDVEPLNLPPADLALEEVAQ